MIVVELAGEEEGFRVPVAFGTDMAVVFVRRDEVVSKPAVALEFDGQRVVISKDQRLGVSHRQELGWQCPVEGPEGLLVLDGHRRVEADRDPLRRAVEASRAAAFGPLAEEVVTGRVGVGRGFAGGLRRQSAAALSGLAVYCVVVEPPGPPLAAAVLVTLLSIAKSGVRSRAGDTHFGVLGGEEFVPALVGVGLARRPAVGKARESALGKRRQRPRVCLLDRRLPGVGDEPVGHAGRVRVQPWAGDQFVEHGSVLGPVRVVFARPISWGVERIGALARVVAGVVALRGQRVCSKGLLPQHALREGACSEQRASGAIGGHVATESAPLSAVAPRTCIEDVGRVGDRAGGGAHLCERDAGECEHVAKEQREGRARQSRPRHCILGIAMMEPHVRPCREGLCGSDI